MPAFENMDYKDAKYDYLGGDQKKIAQKFNKYSAWIKKHPPNVTGWLRGNIDRERMIKLKDKIEKH